jgi:transposase
MLTAMTEEDWTIVLRVFAASRSRRGNKGRNDRKYFVVHNITWRALPKKFGHWNSVWKRFWRLSRSGTFEAFFDALAAMSETFFPKTLYKARARIEQAVAKLKRFKRIALRCEKTAQNYGSFVALALGFILIKSVHTA